MERLACGTCERFRPPTGNGPRCHHPDNMIYDCTEPVSGDCDVNLEGKCKLHSKRTIKGAETQQTVDIVLKGVQGEIIDSVEVSQSVEGVLRTRRVEKEKSEGEGALPIMNVYNPNGSIYCMVRLDPLTGKLIRVHHTCDIPVGNR